MSNRVRPGASGALIVVDVQNCFVTGGSLAVKHGEDVVPVINRIAPAFQNVIVTQDWHTPGHISFASAHPGRKPFETITLPYGDQVLWPDHCVQGTADAGLDPQLNIPQTQLIVRKGFHQDVDSYSAFEEADRRTPTGLEGYLKQRGIKTLFVTGLATDFCVQWTALDARRLSRVFYNLCSNAMDFMPNGGKIFLRFQADENEIVTEIEDTGPGIAPEVADRLFQNFVTFGKSHGTGLGLSICKKIVEDHGGRIWVRNEPGHGAIFCFALPLAK